MKKGSLLVVLHAHLPFVRHPEHEDFLEERWLFEAITETYVPMIEIYDRLLADGVSFRMTMSVTPPLASMLQEQGITNLYVDVGGEAIVRGRSPRGDKWRIGIEKPQYDEPVGETPHEIVNISGWALATSGDYRSYATDDNGSVYSHIFDTRTGRPAQSHVASVSVLATNCMLADGYATTLFAMGPEEGLKWITNVAPAEVLFIMRIETGGFYEVASDGFAEIVSP